MSNPIKERNRRYSKYGYIDDEDEGISSVESEWQRLLTLERLAVRAYVEDKMAISSCYEELQELRWKLSIGELEIDA
jgi:hypothetical protein